MASQVSNPYAPLLLFEEYAYKEANLGNGESSDLENGGTAKLLLLKKVLEQLVSNKAAEKKSGAIRIKAVGYFRFDGRVVYLLPRCYLKPPEKTDENSNESPPPKKTGKEAEEEKNEDKWPKTEEDVNYEHTVFSEKSPINCFHLLESSGKNATPELVSSLAELGVQIYRSLKDYHSRERKETTIEEDLADILASGSNQKATYLDLALQFEQFARRNKPLLVSQILEARRDSGKVNWRRTINLEHPVIQKDETPVYVNLRVVKKQMEAEEELIVLFYSVLNLLRKEMLVTERVPDLGLRLKTPAEICALRKNKGGKALLLRKRHRYFTDLMLSCWKLLLAYFSEADVTGKHPEYLLSRGYNAVFEYMVDTLIGDSEGELKNDYGLWRLKHQIDGKIADHVYIAKGIVGNGLVPWIGDSKFYKVVDSIGWKAVGKQFGYARNAVQHILDEQRNLKNNNENLKKVVVRDEATEGYFPIPNFFMMAYADEENTSRNELELVENNTSEKEYLERKHFLGRLFDRDTNYIVVFQIRFRYLLEKFNSRREALAATKVELLRKIREGIAKYYKGKWRCIELAKLPCQPQLLCNELYGKVIRAGTVYYYAEEKIKVEQKQKGGALS